MPHTIVIGGGLLGLCTAYALASRGETVEVLETMPSVGQGTSFANGGLLVPSMSDPWNGPGVFRHLVASLFLPGSSMKLHAKALPGLVGWGTRFLFNSASSRYRSNALANFDLARYSVARTLAWTSELDLNFSQAEQGSLKLFCDPGSMQASLELVTFLAETGLRFEQLDGAGAVSREPCLQDAGQDIHGALYFPDDISGNAFEFCEALADRCTRAGVVIRGNSPVDRVLLGDGRVCGVLVNNQEMLASRVVIAAGVSSNRLLRRLGASVSLAPVKGYSITLPMLGEQLLPKVAIVDEGSHAVIVALGKRLRVVGGAEFAGYDTARNERQLNGLLEFVRRTYPTLAGDSDLTHAECWAGVRPMSSDGKPFIGPSTVPGLYLNTGHGHLGWTQAVGSAELLADLMTGNAPGVDPDPFACER